MRWGFVFPLALMVAGCGLPYSVATTPISGDKVPTAIAMPVGMAIVTIAQPGYTLQSVARCWLASDVYQYDVTLRYWNGSAYSDFSPAETLVLPQKISTPASQAVFSNLKQGLKYQAEVAAWGNAGGTAATTLLNAESTVAPPVFDFTAGQDVEETQATTYQTQLDPVPFAGTATIVPQSTPTGTTSYTATLQDAAGGTTLCAVSYPATQQATFSNLQAGPTYQVVLQAFENGTLLATAPTVSCAWDASATSLEQSQTVDVTF